MLGTDLVTQLAPEHEVIGVGLSLVSHIHVPYRQVDLAKSDLTEELIREVRPEVILHAAAMTHVDGCETQRAEALRGNFEATRNVVNAVGRSDALIIFFSTDFVFDGSKTEPYTEEDLPRPLSVYGETKLLAERYLLMRAKRYLILRTSWLFGQWGDNFPKKILKRAEGKTPFPVISDQVGNPTYTGDLAEAVSKILGFLSQKKIPAHENQIYHIANEGIVSRCDFARAVLRKRNFSPELAVPVSSAAAPPLPAVRPRNSALSTEKIKQRLGIRLRAWEEALDAYFQKDVGVKA